MSVMLSRLDKIKERYYEINELLMSNEVMKDNRLMAKLAKEQAGLSGIVENYEKLLQIDQHINEAKELLKEHDQEMKEMAQMELEELEPEKERLLNHLEILLIPKDPNDDNDAIVEIRGAAGGDEGNIFAGDLYRMYARFAEEKGWKVNVLEAMVAEAGGYSLISFEIKGDSVYKELKFESGSHRVQRVPKTESQGRIHTSTATVLVMPDVEEADFELNMADLVFDTHRASGAGGQHVNKTDSAVRITHTPTGISVNCQDGRSQHDNRDLALKLIRARIFEEQQRKINEEKGKERLSKIGSGDRSEKIRTYNYPQNRVSDHRIGLTLQKLDRIIEGDLQEIINALLAEDQRSKLAGEQSEL
ncbi:MAG: peptide chain release factor 1 [Erysipelotrichaceae bacterium]